MSAETPVLLVLAGPAGSGKSTLCDRLVQEVPDGFARQTLDLAVEHVLPAAIDALANAVRGRLDLNHDGKVTLQEVTTGWKHLCCCGSEADDAAGPAPAN